MLHNSSCSISEKFEGKPSSSNKIFVIASVALMNPEHPSDISGLLLAWSDGDRDAANQLMAVVYPAMRQIARQHLARRAADESLESAALANEAYLKLIRSRGIRCESRVHFFALCAQMIRRILVDHARSRRYAKRGGETVRVPLDEELLGSRARGVEVLGLDDALQALSKIDARKGRVVELRYFGGLSINETAEVLRMSPETVLRDWKMAKTWLFRELTGRPSKQ
jgi:RNA polymerase sigma factor (TIGR02999 family)